MTRVRLDGVEVDYCQALGTLRHTVTSAQRVDAHGLDVDYADGLALHVDGALGEYAVARALDLLDVWVPFALDCKRLDYDIGRHGTRGLLQVRSTRFAPGMTLRDVDDNAATFVGTRINGDHTVTILGWIEGVHGKTDRYRRTNERGGYWRVPASDLRPLADLARDL